MSQERKNLARAIEGSPWKFVQLRNKVLYGKLLGNGVRGHELTPAKSSSPRRHRDTEKNESKLILPRGGVVIEEMGKRLTPQTCNRRTNRTCISARLHAGTLPALAPCLRTRKPASEASIAEDGNWSGSPRQLGTEILDK